MWAARPTRLRCRTGALPDSSATSSGAWIPQWPLPWRPHHQLCQRRCCAAHGLHKTATAAGTATTSPLLEAAQTPGTARAASPSAEAWREHNYAASTLLQQLQQQLRDRVGSAETGQQDWSPQPQQQQQQQQHPAGPFETNARTITASIKRAQSADRLLAVLSLHGDSLNYIHISAMFAKLAKLTPTKDGNALSLAEPAAAPTAAPSTPTTAAEWAAEANTAARAQTEALAAASVTEALLQRLEQHLPEFGPRALANTLWALGKLGCLPPKRIVAALLAQLDANVQELKAHEHSMALYALAQLQQQVVQRAWQQIRERQLSAGGDGGGSTVQQPHQQPPQQMQQMMQQRLQLLQQQQQHAQQQQQAQLQYQRKPSAALSLRLSLLARHELGLSDPRLLQYLEAAAASFREFGPQALSNALHAVASMGFDAWQLESWLPRFWAASGQLLVASPGDFQPQHLSNLMWAHGRLGVAPSAQWLAAWQAAVVPQLREFNGQGCSNMLWGLVRSGAVPDMEWLSHFIHATAWRLGAFSEQTLSNCCWALARFSADEMTDFTSSGSSSGGASGSSSNSSSNGSSGNSSSCGSSVDGGVWRATVLQLLSESGWIRSMLVVSHRRLTTYTPQQLANTLWSLSMLNVQPSAAWMAAFVDASAPKHAGMSPQEQSMALVALARLGYHPGSAWMGSFEAASRRLLPSCRPQHLSNMVWAMAQLDSQPSQQWQDAFLLECMRRLAVGRRPKALPAALAPGDNAAPVIAVTASTAATTEGAAGSNCSSSTTSSSAAVSPPAFTMQGLANLAWGIATLQLRVPTAFWAVVDAEAAVQLPTATTQGISMLMWAMGTAGVAPSDACLAAALQAAAQKLAGFSVQGLCMLLWALAKVEARPDPALLLPLVERVGQMLFACHASEQSNSASNDNDTDASSRGSRHAAGHIIAISSNSSRNRSRQGVGSTTRSSNSSSMYQAPTTRSSYSSSSSGSSYHTPIITTSGSASRSASASSEDNAMSLWALAKLGFYPGQPWMASWLSSSSQQLGLYSARQLAMVLWALGVLQEVPPKQWMAAWAAAWGDRVGAAAVDVADEEMVAAANRLLATLQRTQ